MAFLHTVANKRESLTGVDVKILFSGQNDQKGKFCNFTF